MKTITSRGMLSFLVIWFGQLVSLTGSGLTGFALGVWVFQSTGSVTQFALISLFTSLPGILFSPIAGALVDRWDRRWAMILSDTGAGLCTLSVALLFFSGQLAVWHIYVAMAISSTFSAFQWPAYSAATTLLVPKEHLARASGLVQLAEAVAQIASPAMAGALMGIIAVYGIILIDFLTFLFAIFTLLVVHVPKPGISAEGEAGKGSLLFEAAYGWTYIYARSGLLALLIFFAVSNFATGIVAVLFTPLVLSFTTPIVLGTLLSIGGLGFLAGSLAMSTWGGPRRRVYGIIASNLLAGAVLLLAGFPPRAWILAMCAFTFFFGLPITNGCSQAIWQSKTALDVQGRVFSVRRMIAWSSLPLAYLIAGPLVDQLFEPLMAEGGWLASIIGQIIGGGSGLSIRLLFIIMGLIILLATLVLYFYPRFRNVEVELPDVITDQVPATASG
jgi:hypothetical protein